VFDCVGRLLLSVPALVPQRNPNRWLIVLMLMRLMFFPLFLWRALPSLGNNSDAYAFIVVALFSASNGFVGTLAMQEGPRYCKEKDRELAGTVLAFCLMVCP
jgi:predicted permease